MKSENNLESLNKKVNFLIGDTFECLSIFTDSDIITNDTKIKLKHLKCNTVFEYRYKNVKERCSNKKYEGRRHPICPECDNRGTKFTYNKVKKLIEQNAGYKLLTEESDYTNTKDTRLTIKHTKCNTVFESKWSNFYNNGTRCFKCYHDSIKKMMTNEEYSNLVRSTYGDEYTILGEYLGKSIKILTKHNVCGNKWNIDPYHFIECKNRCPYCFKIPIVSSKTNQLISKIVEEIGLTSSQEVKIFKNKNTKMYLVSDVVVEELNLIIECDGKQHYSPMFGDLEKFEKQKERDCIKNEMMFESDYNFIRIPYTFYKEKDLRLLIEALNKTISSEAKKVKLILERSTTIESALELISKGSE